MRRRWRCGVGTLAAAVLAVTPVVVGCSAAAPEHVGLDVDAVSALEDQPVHVNVTGLRPGQEVTVSVEATDWQTTQWHSHAVFHADSGGRVSLDSAAPVSGSYQGADGMGLFWSMDPDHGNPDESAFFPALGSTFQVTLNATVDGHVVASRQLTRVWQASGVTSRKLTVAADGVAGELFLPSAGASRHTAVLAFGGSEGGDSAIPDAMLLASHGYPCLALGYFKEPGLPQTLTNVPLEYFASAAKLLAAQPGVDPAHILTLGYSRGSEAAQLVADDYPALIHGAVVYSPSSRVNGSFPGGQFAAWTRNGQGIPLGPIPLDHVDGPVLAIGGGADFIWPGGAMAAQIDQELSADHDPYPHQALVYPDAGHGVGTYPYLASGTESGGTHASNEAAKLASWGRLLAFLAAVRR